MDAFDYGDALFYAGTTEIRQLRFRGNPVISPPDTDVCDPGNHGILISDL